MKLTLGFAMDQLGEYADGGSCKDRVIIKRINEAVRFLLRSGDYESIDRYCLWTCNNCITLPPDVAYVRKARVDDCLTPVHTKWFEFLSGAGEECCDWLCDAITHRGDEHVTFADLPFPMYLMANSDLDEDDGAKIFVSGTDHLDQTVRSKDEDGIRFGEKIAIESMEERVITQNRFKTITLVEKPKTKGIVRLYGWLPEDEACELGLESNNFMIGYYLPWETRPCYTRIEISHNHLNHAHPHGHHRNRKVTLLVKRKWIPLVHRDQILPINNLDALTEALLAINARKDSDPIQRREFERNAKQAMADQQEDTRNDQAEMEVQMFNPEIIV